MNIKGLVHVNINCSDFDLSLKFYELLGFQKVLEVPEKNTPEVAAAVGMPPYKVKGALIILQNSRPNPVDYTQWPGIWNYLTIFAIKCSIRIDLRVY